MLPKCFESVFRSVLERKTKDQMVRGESCRGEIMAVDCGDCYGLLERRGGGYGGVRAGDGRENERGPEAWG